MLLDIGKVLRSRLDVDRIGRPCKVSDQEAMFRVSHMQHGFEAAELLHAFEKRVSNECDAITRIQYQWQLCFLRCNDRWTGRCFLEDTKLEETGVLCLLSIACRLQKGTNSEGP